jgi:replication factor C subunit 1
MDDITHTNMSNKNIMSLFYNNKKKIAIIMDEIDGMNSGDKGGINSLIKLIRPKKTKKQKLEKTCVNPIICIGNYRFDKKIKELMKVCNLVEIANPTNIKIKKIIDDFMNDIPLPIKNEIVLFVNGDLRKLEQIFQIYRNNKELLTINLMQNILQNKMYNNETKKITKK